MASLWGAGAPREQMLHSNNRPATQALRLVGLIGNVNSMMREWPGYSLLFAVGPYDIKLQEFVCCLSKVKLFGLHRHIAP